MSDFDSLCKGCMTEIGEQKICPKCGYSQDEKQSAPYLPIGTVLEGRYIVGKKVDQNGEGVGYIAYDSINKHPIYIREFLPLSMCKRDGADLRVEPFTSRNNDYCLFRDSFLRYFRSVARFRTLSAIIPVYDIFSQNNTAYTVSEWVDSISLTQFVQRNGGRIDWNIAQSLFMPVVSCLGKMHAAGVRHLGICPDNLAITRNGKMKLLGFAIPILRTSNSSFSTELYDGCSAIEQYAEGGKVNEYTDVYGLSASLFFALTGTYPINAHRRRGNDRLLISTDLLEKIPHHVVSAIANGLQVLPEYRTPSFERLRAELSASPSMTNDMEPKRENKERKKSSPKWALSLVSCLIALLVFVILGAIWFLGSDFRKDFDTVTASDVHEQQKEDLDLESVIKGSSNSILVPNLRGLELEKIKAEATESSEFQVFVSSDEFNDNIPEGCIISQVPDAGTEIEKGSAVVVTVSKGAKMRNLPNISGLTLSEASLKVTDAGFKPIQVQAYSDTVADGVVIGYEGHKAGSTLEYASEVKIVVSKGKNPGV